MAIQYAPNISNTSAIGTGLGQGIQELATRKIGELQKRERAAELSQLLQATKRYSPEEANLIASLGEKDFATHADMFKGGYQAPQTQGPQSNQSTDASEIDSLQQRLKAIQSNRPEQVTSGDLSSLSANQKAQGLGLPTNKPEAPFDLSKVTARDLLAQAAANGLNLSPEQQQKATAKLEAIQADKNQLASLQNDLNAYIKKQQGQQQQSNQQIQAQPQEQQLYSKPKSGMEKIAEKTFELKKEAAQDKRDAEIRKENKKFRDEVNTKRKSAKTKLRDLDRLDELEDENLETAGYKEFLDRSGFDIPALMNPQSQEYEKIATGWIREAGNIFKGKVSNYEADIQLKLIPTLSMSPEGRKRVRANMRYAEEAEIAYGQAMDDIIRQNGGKEPRYLEEKVLARIDPKLEKLATKFKANLKKPVPEGQDPLVTAFQAGLGQAIGGISLKGAAKGALTGAAIGSAVPGIGTTAGAIGGGITGALGGSVKDLL